MNSRRHPWLEGLIPHHSLTRNFGLAGGYLACTVWCFPNGDPSGFSTSEWRAGR